MLLGKLKKPVQDNGPEIIGHQILWGNAALAFNIKKLGTQSTFFSYASSSTLYPCQSVGRWVGRSFGLA